MRGCDRGLGDNLFEEREIHASMKKAQGIGDLGGSKTQRSEVRNRPDIHTCIDEFISLTVCILS